MDIPMPLYIKDAAVADLVERLQRATGAPSKTAAVRVAVTKALSEAEKRQPMMERLAPTLALAELIGPGIGAGPFDQKAFFDEQWGE